MHEVAPERAREQTLRIRREHHALHRIDQRTMEHSALGTRLQLKLGVRDHMPTLSLPSRNAAHRAKNVDPPYGSPGTPAHQHDATKRAPRVRDFPLLHNKHIEFPQPA